MSRLVQKAYYPHIGGKWEDCRPFVGNWRSRVYNNGAKNSIAVEMNEPENVCIEEAYLQTGSYYSCLERVFNGVSLF